MNMNYKNVLILEGSKNVDRHLIKRLILGHNCKVVYIQMSADDALSPEPGLAVINISPDSTEKASCILEMTLKSLPNNKIDVYYNPTSIEFYGSFESTTDNQLDKIINRHLVPTLHMTKAIYGYMFKAKHNTSIITPVSSFGLGGFPYMATYSAIEASISTLVDSLAMEKEGSRLNFHKVTMPVIDIAGDPFNLSKLCSSQGIKKVSVEGAVSGLVHVVEKELVEFIPGVKSRFLFKRKATKSLHRNVMMIESMRSFVAYMGIRTATS